MTKKERRMDSKSACPTPLWRTTRVSLYFLFLVWFYFMNVLLDPIKRWHQNTFFFNKKKLYIVGNDRNKENKAILDISVILLTLSHSHIFSFKIHSMDWKRYLFVKFDLFTWSLKQRIEIEIFNNLPTMIDCNQQNHLSYCKEGKAVYMVWGWYTYNIYHAAGYK